MYTSRPWQLSVVFVCVKLTEDFLSVQPWRQMIHVTIMAMKRGSDLKHLLIGHRNVAVWLLGNFISLWLVMHAFTWAWLCFLDLLSVTRTTFGNTQQGLGFCERGIWGYLWMHGWFFSLANMCCLYNPPNKHLHHFNSRPVTYVSIYECVNMIRSLTSVTGPEAGRFHYYAGISSRFLEHHEVLW